MIITKEQQEAWIDAYIKQGHNQDECIGFIDGIEKVMSIVKNCNKPAVVRQSELLICGNCKCKHSNKEYDGYCSQSCFDGVQ